MSVDHHSSLNSVRAVGFSSGGAELPNLFQFSSDEMRCDVNTAYTVKRRRFNGWLHYLRTSYYFVSNGSEAMDAGFHAAGRNIRFSSWATSNHVVIVAETPRSRAI